MRSCGITFTTSATMPTTLEQRRPPVHKTPVEHAPEGQCIATQERQRCAQRCAFRVTAVALVRLGSSREIGLRKTHPSRFLWTWMSTSRGPWSHHHEPSRRASQHHQQCPVRLPIEERGRYMTQERAQHCGVNARIDQDCTQNKRCESENHGHSTYAKRTPTYETREKLAPTHHSDFYRDPKTRHKGLTAEWMITRMDWPKHTTC